METAMSEQNMVCPKCQTFQPRAATCTECGVTVGQPTTADSTGDEKIAQPTLTPSPRTRQPRRFPLLAVIGVVALGVAVWGGTQLFSSGPTLDEQMQDIPVFQMLKTNDLAAYERLKTLLVQSVESGASKPEIIARVQIFAASLMKEYLPKASDDAVDNYAYELQRILEDARQQSASLCYDLLYTERYGRPQVRLFMEQRVDTRFLDAMGAVIQSANQDPQSPPDAVRAQELLQGALRPLVERHREEMLVFQKSSHSEKEKQQVCDLGRKMYKQVLLMSKRNASIALRYMITVS